MTKITDKSKLFQAAWAVARKAAAKFGGAAREFFADALRKGYAFIKSSAAKVAKPIELTVAAKVSALAGIVITWPRDLRKTFAYSFALDNAERVARFGEKTSFSAKQTQIINDMYVKYAA